MTASTTAVLTDEQRAELLAAVDVAAPTIADVIARLQEIQRISREWPPLAEDNGIAAFNKLYLRITQDVKDAYDGGRLFHCGEFILQLDVAFAGRYLAAMKAWVSGAPQPPGCWALLFDRHDEESVPPWRFAAAGVNAHVNFDLAFALLDVWEANPIPLAATEDQRADYNGINDIFYRRMEELCETFDAPWSVPNGTTVWERAGKILGDVLVWGTRDIAWTFAERMWDNRRAPDYRVGPTETLDLLVTGFAKAII